MLKILLFGQNLQDYHVSLGFNGQEDFPLVFSLLYIVLRSVRSAPMKKTIFFCHFYGIVVRELSKQRTRELHVPVS